MKHYVQYHNTDKQGARPAGGAGHFQIFAKKSIRHLPGHTVWLVSGEGDKPKRYYLEYVFVVAGVTPGDPHTAWGTEGQRFDPPLPLNALPWFRPFVDSQQNFSLGVREIAPEYLAHLEALRQPTPLSVANSSPHDRLAHMSAREFLQGLRTIQARLDPAQVEMLVGHANAPGLSLTMEQLAACGGYVGVESGNRQYGHLGGLLAEALGLQGLEEQIQSLAVRGAEADELGHWQWQMRPALREALRQLWPDDVLPEPMAEAAAPAPDDESLPPTERAALILARVGQGRYRKGLLDLWQGRCALTGLDIEPVLVASHAKPWRDCSNAERLDPYNGLLLSATLDRLFDVGLISFGDGGDLLVSPALGTTALQRLGLSRDARLRSLYPQHLPYLQAHRQRIFKRAM